MELPTQGGGDPQGVRASVVPRAPSEGPGTRYARLREADSRRSPAFSRTTEQASRATAPADASRGTAHQYKTSPGGTSHPRPAVVAKTATPDATAATQAPVRTESSGFGNNIPLVERESGATVEWRPRGPPRRPQLLAGVGLFGIYVGNLYYGWIADEIV